MPSKNRFSMSRIIEALHPNTDAHSLAAITKSFIQEKLLDIPYVDLTIHFIGASGIPKLDLGALADPYFVANLDGRISYVSSIQVNTLKPVWNEIWRVKNVPTTASLSVEVLDKDDGVKRDDYVGKFTTTIAAGAKEAEIVGPVLRRAGGTFWLKIDSVPAERDPNSYSYMFDGPIRFSRHFSPTLGLLTNTTTENHARLYTTWKLFIRGIPIYFGDQYQQWNHSYKAAQKIFGPGPSAAAVRSGIMAGHRMLYARSTTNKFGVIDTGVDVLGVLRGGARVKPAVYTYIISAEDDSLRFSETGAAFFVDFASKHALHANCHPCVRYSGEFHPRPAGGWAAFNDEIPDSEVRWELVVDNNSGTYSPDKTLLPKLKELLEHNFPDVAIFALDREDPENSTSREACRAYALEHRGIKKEELQPQRHAGEGEVTLANKAVAISEEELQNFQL